MPARDLGAGLRFVGPLPRGARRAPGREARSRLRDLDLAPRDQRGERLRFGRPAVQGRRVVEGRVLPQVEPAPDRERAELAPAAGDMESAQPSAQAFARLALARWTHAAAAAVGLLAT